MRRKRKGRKRSLAECATVRLFTVGNVRAVGIKKTIQWYLDNKEWWETIISGEYQNYYEKMYSNR